MGPGTPGGYLATPIMSDLKLFKLASDHVTELTVSSMALEKSIQSLTSKADVEKVRHLIQQSYEAN